MRNRWALVIMAASAIVVSEFASSLDAEDYPLTESYLADNCVYESPTGDLTGTAIIDSYKGSGDIARKRFDSIVYRHEIKPLSEGWYQVTFIDELFSGRGSHVFRCNQQVRVENGRIVRIIHQEIPGERERLDAFTQCLG